MANKITPKTATSQKAAGKPEKKPRKNGDTILARKAFVHPLGAPSPVLTHLWKVDRDTWRDKAGNLYPAAAVYRNQPAVDRRDQQVAALEAAHSKFMNRNKIA